MNFFLLPRILISMLSEDIGIFPYNKDMEVENKYYISKTLHKYLNKVKEEIEEYYGEWDNYKKYTNIYEFIHTYIPDTTTSICNLKPLSRSFFKMIEIVKSFNILDKLEAKGILGEKKSKTGIILNIFFVISSIFLASSIMILECSDSESSE